MNPEKKKKELEDFLEEIEILKLQEEAETYGIGNLRQETAKVLSEGSGEKSFATINEAVNKIDEEKKIRRGNIS